MSRNSQRQRYLGVDNAVDGSGNVGGKDLWPAELFVAPMRSEPDFAKGALLGKNNLGIKHSLRCVCV